MWSCKVGTIIFFLRGGSGGLMLKTSLPQIAQLINGRFKTGIELGDWQHD